VDILNRLPEDRYNEVDDLLTFVSIYDDDERTRAYEAMLRRHRDLIEGKVVVEAGCGLGIFSAAMARLGARLELLRPGRDTQRAVEAPGHPRQRAFRRRGGETLPRHGTAAHTG